MKLIAVTGACGFIGRAATEALLARGDAVYAVDALTYAADPTLPALWAETYGSRFSFVARDINDLGRLPDVDAVLNLAAESHVDNSIADSTRCLRTNVTGTAHLLDLCRAASTHDYRAPRFVHVSTDEVYGDIGEGAPRTELHRLNPSSPYAASKAAADLLIGAWARTHGVAYNIVRPTNVYGPHQHPEKLIPRAVRALMTGRTFHVHGSGAQTRQWLAVADLVSALLCVLDTAPANEVYNVGGNCEASVTDVVRAVGVPAERGFARPGADSRYALNDAKLRALGWAPQGAFWAELPGLVAAERARFRW